MRGIEAALAAARMGCSVCCFAINLDSVGNMPCNPAIGGTGKAHLVRELDAMGGEMAHAADLSCIQYRTLNLGKGPAVYSLRAQADRRRYQAVMKLALESQEGLRLIQGEIVDVELRPDGAVEAGRDAQRRALGAAARPSSARAPTCAAAPSPARRRRTPGRTGWRPASPSPGGWRRWGFRCGASKRAPRRA